MSELEKEGGGAALVLSDPERMNKKLISLSPPPATSQTVLSRRDCGSALGCAHPASTVACFPSTSDCYLHGGWIRCFKCEQSRSRK